MRVRILYPMQYKYFEDSPLATYFDRFCHSPLPFPIGAFLSLVLIMLYGSLLSPLIDYDRYGSVVRFISGTVLIAYYVFLLCLGVICDRYHLSEKLAAWDIQRTMLGKGFPLKFWIILVLVVCVFLFPLAAKDIQAYQEERYHESMTAFLSGDGPYEGTGIVSYNPEQGRYSKLFLPRNFAAKKPEDVRYLLTYQEGAKLVVAYSGGMTYHDYSIPAVGGYQRYYVVSLTDLTDGQTVAREVFWGSVPPNALPQGTYADLYGSYPDPDQITFWLQQVFPS